MPRSNSKRASKLSNETSFALRHITSTLVNICRYLLSEVKFDYILLGKFQTDNLENRFGLCRRMCGLTTTFLSTEVLESRKKLRVMNLLKVRNLNSSFQISNLLDAHGNSGNVDVVLDISKFQSMFDDASRTDV